MSAFRLAEGIVNLFFIYLFSDKRKGGDKELYILTFVFRIFMSALHSGF